MHHVEGLLPCLYYRTGGEETTTSNGRPGKFTCGTLVAPEGSDQSTPCSYSTEVDAKFRVTNRNGACPMSEVARRKLMLIVIDTGGVLGENHTLPTLWTPDSIPGGL